ncbi:hypothetical protein EBN03_23375 [Nocardia stercoris]|uniref:Uncharacterized protein n=2 Tax=Nocardia stercoris TaxID=2483361 RepID=A0A3M2KX95_9NOCA|nr:hypothetical protein EBN03_23375 [Nocardia stercoris]
MTADRFEINAWPLLVVDIDLNSAGNRLSDIARPISRAASSAAPELQRASERAVSELSGWWRDRRSKRGVTTQP